MAVDPFDDLLSLEDDFYQEGYEAGIADGENAGLVEGKIFGIEKGYEKALELGKLHGRGIVWQKRISHSLPEQIASLDMQSKSSQYTNLLAIVEGSKLSKNNRLTKHIEGLITVTGEESIAMDNSDEAVSEFDDRLSKAQAKAKVIAAIAGEQVRIEQVSELRVGIEESRGLNARH